MPTTTDISIALLGGAVLGASLALLTAVTGSRMGVSGMIVALRAGSDADQAIARAFLAGSVVCGALLAVLAPGFAIDTTARPLIAFTLGGILVGWGSRRANGCTSGHGIYGVSRGSARSFVAVALFWLGATIVINAWPAGAR